MPTRTMKQTNELNQIDQQDQGSARYRNQGWLRLRVAALLLFLVSVAAPLVAQEAPAAGVAPRAMAVAKAPAVSDEAALVSEFDVNGLKVLVKRREGSQTVVAGLFIKGGARNISPANAGIEDLMLDAMSEATVS